MLRFVIASAAVASAAAAGTWKKSYDAHIAVGAAAGDQNTGVVAGGTPSAACLYETTDYGKSWVCDDSKTTLFLDVGLDSTGKNQVAAQILSAPTYSSDGGKTFQKGKVKGQLAWMGQSVEFASFSDDVVALAGQGIPNGNGLAVSTDAGKTWESFDIGADEPHQARYVAVASATTWYVTAGTWPSHDADEAEQLTAAAMRESGLEEDDIDDFRWDDFLGNGEVDARTMAKVAKAVRGEFELSEAVKISPAGLSMSAPRRRLTLGAAEKKEEGGNSDGYYAGVWKTTDAGATWTQVFGDDVAAGRFYPNGIGCASETHCSFVAEGFGETGAESGGWVFTTTDGGATWTQTLKVDAGSSMMAIRYLSENEAWAAGGMMRGKVKAYYYHSTDGGATWDLESTYPGVSVIGMDLADESHGFAAAVTVFQQGIIMTYSDGSATDDATDDGAADDGGSADDGDDDVDCHFEDPYTTGGCRSDEAGPIQIQGIDGAICAPECTDQDCPTDTCQGSATPQCALSSPQGQKFCALICTPSLAALRGANDDQCGDKASCKPIQGTGICTYDE